MVRLGAFKGVGPAGASMPAEGRGLPAVKVSVCLSRTTSGRLALLSGADSPALT